MCYRKVIEFGKEMSVSASYSLICGIGDSNGERRAEDCTPYQPRLSSIL